MSTTEPPVRDEPVEPGEVPAAHPYEGDEPQPGAEPGPAAPEDEPDAPATGPTAPEDE